VKRAIVAFSCGLVFGAGLIISQMSNPAKVIGFLDITGNWDPSLMFVMIGALAVAFVSFKWALKRPAPILDDGFHVSKRREIDKPLLLGAGLFGIGWGMTGYCPGPAVSGLGLGTLEALVMVASIYAGFFAQKWFAERK
jgi:uncharacterized protein